MTRHLRPLALMLAASALLAAIPAPAQTGAPPPQQARTTPGYFRTMLGQFEVTVLSDGTVTIPLRSILTHAHEKTIDGLLRRAWIDPARSETSVNAFLIHTGGRLALIDAGAGKLFGPDAGRLVHSLRASGYRPEDVTDVMLTHIHGDHSGGLTVDGKAVFPNALVHVRREEAEFWLDAVNKPKTAARHAHAFDQAGRDLAPYLAAGRVRMFDADGELVPGIRALAAPGHTPGHTLYEIESEGRKLVLWGDLIHAKDAQFPSPGIAILYDVNEQAAAGRRRAVMAEAAARGHLVGAAHISFPGIGRVRAEGKGYQWVPLNYSEQGLSRPGG
ncbi:MBL fold metallo-hydrolase [Noviherbaspirillum aridicola]|uniref:MBL fold hydrolase n=1 Tax=Noviherbaspirillum aridicola TaxID=2849687 RepID=A0ABQ4PZY0_9BURK|nr:MBL fold metallo-hydrolase [Noviherbaspirillum aridicola]GIZ50444.1 MBL fold hydrolase [Noviherbaspirillum aridicola]